MADYGRVLAVTTHTVGDELLGDHAMGATILKLDDSADFPEDGGTVSTDLGLLDFTAVDPDTDTMTLVYPLPTALPDESRVELWDADLAAVATETVASVVMEGSEDDGDPFEATVPQNLRGYLPEGLRGDRGVMVEVDVDAQTVIDVPGRSPQLDGQVVWHPHSMRTSSKSIRNGNPPTQVNGWADVETDGITFAIATWTIITPGWYEMTLAGEWATNGTGKRQMTIRINDVAYRQRVEAADPTDTTYMDLTTQARLVEGDRVTVWVFQNSGAKLDLTSTSFAIYRISI